MKKAVILGASGFIGQHLKARFEKEGYEVVGIDSHITSTPKPGIISKNGLYADIPPCDVILHFASPASPVHFNRLWHEIYEANVFLTNKLLYAAHAWNTQLIFASTSEIYGEPEVHPQTEEYRGSVSTIGPRAIYDNSKRLGETLCSIYRRKFNVDARIVRIFNTYGPGMSDDGRILDACKQALRTGEPLTINGDGEQTRSFCYVSDLVEGIWKLHNYKGNEWIFNLGNPEEVTINGFVREFEKLTGIMFNKRYTGILNEPARRRPDITRAMRELDWKPTIPLLMGLAQTLKTEGVIANED